MALIPDGQEDQFKFLGVVVLLGLGAIYWLYLHAPRGEELALQEDRLEQLQFQNQRLEARAGGLDRLREGLAARHALLRETEARLPGSEEVAALYDRIARAADGNDLELVSVTSTRPDPAEGGHYLRLRWLMVVEGDYHRIGRFLSDVAAMDRIVRPTVVQVVPPGESEGTAVQTSLELETLVMRPEGDSAGSTVAAGVGGG